jgi:predicted nucleic acid-binding Zn ribbon protein
MEEIMPIYTFRNTVTGEEFDKLVKFSELDEYHATNPNLVKIITSAPSLISGTKSTMSVAGSEWNDHLSRIKKGSGKENKINT